MPTTEDSVLTSLNELRRLRKERQKKGHSGRGAGGRSHRAATAHDPMGDQITPPPRSDLLPAAKGPRAGGHPTMGQSARSTGPGAGLPGPMAPTWDTQVDPAALARVARPTSSAKPAVIVAVVLLAGAGIGYVKLQNDTQALMAEKEAAIRRVEEARVQAVEAAAKTERQAQLKLKACEAKSESASAAAAAAAPAHATPSATAAMTPAASPPSSSRGRHKSSGRRAAAAAVVPAGPAEPSAVPSLPHKKKLDNDPLAGIKI